jgi:hypothetical protein
MQGIGDAGNVAGQVFYVCVLNRVCVCVHARARVHMMCVFVCVRACDVFVFACERVRWDTQGQDLGTFLANALTVCGMSAPVVFIGSGLSVRFQRERERQCVRESVMCVSVCLSLSLSLFLFEHIDVHART